MTDGSWIHDPWVTDYFYRELFDYNLRRRRQESNERAVAWLRSATTIVKHDAHVADWWVHETGRPDCPSDFERAVGLLLRDAYLTELDRRLDAEFAGFKPIGILSALSARDPDDRSH